jgi:ketosteroid isomerase-like protein
MQAVEEIDAAVRHLGRMMFDRDGAFADEFTEDGVLVGSEAGEIARGRDAIRTLIANFHALPDRYIWDWHTLDIAAAGNVGWVFAEGEVVRSGVEGRQSRPYRLSGVLEREDGRWRWRLFHGAEPKV